MDIQKAIKEKLKEILENKGIVLNLDDILLQVSDERKHGDFMSNVALKNAKKAGLKPLELAQYVSSSFSLEGVKKVEAIAPGFLNFFLESELLGSLVKKIIDEDKDYGNLNLGNNKRICIEYVSANPTGSLHLGHARGAAVGDSLARIYKKAGYDVTREYYINDAGNQVDNLAESLMIRYQQLFGIKKELTDNSYHGEEIIKMAQDIKEKDGDKYLADIESHRDFFKQYGIDHLLDAIKEDLRQFRVEQDVYTSEKKIRESGLVEDCLKKLEKYCYRSEGALFLNTTKDGDDKDRVLIKSDGSYTYLVPDIAYHVNKYERKFDKLIDIFGADHHGYILRLKSALKDLGYNPDLLDVSLIQMVRLFKDGQEFKMSKRTGNAISLKELIEECSIDAIRYFFVSRSSSSHLDFDIDLAKTLGVENPVFYTQYTHARLSGILANGKAFMPFDTKGDLLSTDSERNLLLALKDYPEVIKEAVMENGPYKITNYVYSLAKLINEFYTVCRVLDDNNIALSKQRLALVKACQIVMKDSLNLIGVLAPEKMISLDKKEDIR